MLFSMEHFLVTNASNFFIVLKTQLLSYAGSFPLFINNLYHPLRFQDEVGTYSVINNFLQASFN